MFQFPNTYIFIHFTTFLNKIIKKLIVTNETLKLLKNSFRILFSRKKVTTNKIIAHTKDKTLLSIEPPTFYHSAYFLPSFFIFLVCKFFANTQTLYKQGNKTYHLFIFYKKNKVFVILSITNIAISKPFDYNSFSPCEKVSTSPVCRSSEYIFIAPLY